MELWLLWLSVDVLGVHTLSVPTLISSNRDFHYIPDRLFVEHVSDAA